MGIFSKLFSSINTHYSSEVKSIYNQGVISLSEGNLPQAIHYFRLVEDEHASAAYNLGLIYLDGAGVLLPDYDKARYYFQLADKLGHKKAQQSAQVIGFKHEKTITDNEAEALLMYSCLQFFEGNQIGNLSYWIANRVIFTQCKALERITDSLDPNIARMMIIQFIDYEIFCIRNYASNEVSHFYHLSSLKNYISDDELEFTEDWENGETAKISDFINTLHIPIIFQFAKKYGKNLKLEELGIVRLCAVNYVYMYFTKKWGIFKLIPH